MNYILKVARLHNFLDIEVVSVLPSPLEKVATTLRKTRAEHFYWVEIEGNEF